MRAGIAIAVILFLGLDLLQIGATIAGIEYFFGIPWPFAAFISLIIGFWPVVGTALGVVGAHYGWGWSWLSAFMLFFGLLVVTAGVALAAGLFAVLRERYWRKGVPASSEQGCLADQNISRIEKVKDGEKSHAPSAEATFFAMIQTAETIREAYGKSLGREVAGRFRAESTLPASRDKIAAALVLAAFRRKSQGQLDEQMYNVFQVCYGTLAHYVSDEIAERERKLLEFTKEHRGAAQERLEVQLRVSEEAKGKDRLEKAQQEQLDEARRKAEKEAQEQLLQHGGDPLWFAKELSKYDIQVEARQRSSEEFGRLCDEFKRRLEALDDPSKKAEELTLLRQTLLPDRGF